MSKVKTIYKFNEDCGRMGSLEGIFVSTPEEIESLIGKQVDFGEVLGKHSEVIVNIETTNFTAITTDEKFIELFEKYDMSSGFNPFDYLEG